MNTAPIVSPDAGAFLFPGTSTISTFRASVASTTAGFGAGDNFFSTDAFPGTMFGETPFGWSPF